MFSKYFYKRMREPDRLGERYDILRSELCQRDVLKPPPNKKIKYDPDALDNFAEHLRSKAHCKKVAMLSDDKLQTFTTLGGQTVAFNHKTGQTNEPSVNASSASWASWHRTVDACAQANGEPREQWQGPDEFFPMTS